MEYRPGVALIYGGVGCERDVSISGAKYLCTLIDRSKYDLICILINELGEWMLCDPASPETESQAVHPIRMYGRGGILSGGDFYPIDAAFPLLHGDFGEDGITQGLLTSLGIPYVGCDGISGGVALDKVYTKILAEYLSIPTASFISASPGLTSSQLDTLKRKAEAAIGYPMFMKPARLGSSVGIAEVNSPDDFISAYKIASAHGGCVLIEKRINIAYEAECAYFSVKNKEIITNPGAISCSDGCYDYDKKYSGSQGASILTSPPFTEKEREKIKSYAKKISEFLMLRHLSRIDFFVTEEGEILFNEINTMPGFTSDSLYPKLIEASGLGIKAAVDLMLKDAMGSK